MMKLLRRAHTYLGVFFAPLLLFYVCTGWYQTVTEQRNKARGQPGDWISNLTSVHVDQIYPAATATRYSPALFRVLVVTMSISLILTIALGIFLAFRSNRKPWPIWISLACGILLPILFLWLGQKR